MGERNRYLFLELFFTFLCFESLIFLFGDILSPYQIYLTLGLACGFGFSWFGRNWQNPFIKVSVNVVVLAVFAWIVYSLLHSSLLYREVILSFIKGGILLGIVFSFYPPSLGYAQALSLPLFMCFPVFVRDYNQSLIILALFYIICWVVILKVKFYKFFSPEKEKIKGKWSPIIMSVLFFLIVMFISQSLFYSFSWDKVIKTGLLFEESNKGEKEKDTLDKDYYGLQDKVQKEVTEVILKSDSSQDSHNMLISLSSLIKESPSVMETEKAELGLMSRLKTPGPGLERSQSKDISIHIENYVDKKIQFNLDNLKENIASSLKMNKFNLMQKMSILDLLNKMQSTDSNQKINENYEHIRKSINNSSSGNNAKKDLRKLVDRFKEWKKLGAYRKKADSLHKKIESLGEPLKREAEELASDISNINNLPELKEAENQIQQLKNKTQFPNNDLTAQMKEHLDSKADMFLSNKAAQLGEKIDSLKLPENASQELKEKIDEIKNSQDYQGLLKNLSEYRETIEENRVNAAKETKEFLEVKAHMVLGAKKDKIREALRKSNMADKGEELIKEIERLESEKDSKKLDSAAKKIQDNIDKFSSQGFISGSSKENLTKEIREITDLLQSEIKAEEENAQKEPSRKTSSSDYRDKWQELLENSSLKEERKQALRQLTKELFEAATVSRLENIKKAGEDEIDSSSKDAVKKEEIKKIKDAFDSIVEIERMFIIDKELSSLRQKIEDLKATSPREAAEIQELLDKMMKSRTNEELKKQIEALEEHIETKAQESEKKSKAEEKENVKKGDLDIYVLPLHSIIPMGSSVTLRAVAVYKDQFIKELGPELQWFSSEPYVAWVDEKGTVHSQAKGSTQIYCNYNGLDSQKVEVMVVDKLDEQVNSVVESEIVE